MAMRVLLVAALLTVGNFVASAQAQTVPSETSAKTSTAATPSKKEIRAAKKAERIAIRKKRAECYDKAKKESVPDKDLARFLNACKKQ